MWRAAPGTQPVVAEWLCGVRWGPDFSWWLLPEVYKRELTVLCSWHRYTIVCQLKLKSYVPRKGNWTTVRFPLLVMKEWRGSTCQNHGKRADLRQQASEDSSPWERGQDWLDLPSFPAFSLGAHFGWLGKKGASCKTQQSHQVEGDGGPS